jgi:hypothetical protein
VAADCGLESWRDFYWCGIKPSGHVWDPCHVVWFVLGRQRSELDLGNLLQVDLELVHLQFLMEIG